MKIRMMLIIITIAIAFASIDAWGQCYNAPGCENIERDLITSTTWPDTVNQIRWRVSTNRNGSRIIDDATDAADEWNDARCDTEDTGFPELRFLGTTNAMAGNTDNLNVVGFAYVDGPGGKLAYDDVIEECDVKLDYYHDHDTHDEWNNPRPRSQIGYCTRDTITHELGHWIKLNDVTDRDTCRTGTGQYCMDYFFYTMHGCPEKDQHHRETLHDADIHGAWLMYNGAAPAPSAIKFPPAEQHTVNEMQTRLLQNYPDPFNPETWIPYERAENANVTITIYDASGNRVRQFNLGEKSKGQYVETAKAVHWDGRNSYGESVVSGVYFYTLQANDFSQTKSLLVLK